MNTENATYLRSQNARDLTRLELFSEFGAIPDFYPSEEITREDECRWRASARDWADAIQAAEAAIIAGDSEGVQLALDRASRVERVQKGGEDPSTCRFSAMFSSAADHDEATGLASK
jgi:hypothetical protein